MYLHISNLASITTVGKCSLTPFSTRGGGGGGVKVPSLQVMFALRDLFFLCTGIGMESKVLRRNRHTNASCVTTAQK